LLGLEPRQEIQNLWCYHYTTRQRASCDENKTFCSKTDVPCARVSYEHRGKASLRIQRDRPSLACLAPRRQERREHRPGIRFAGIRGTSVQKQSNSVGMNRAHESHHGRVSERMASLHTRRSKPNEQELTIPQATVAIEMVKKLSHRRPLDCSEFLRPLPWRLRASNAFWTCFSRGGDAVQVNIRAAKRANFKRPSHLR
jgi:hypothetical protein